MWGGRDGRPGVGVLSLLLEKGRGSDQVGCLLLTSSSGRLSDGRSLSGGVEGGCVTADHIISPVILLGSNCITHHLVTGNSR